MKRKRPPTEQTPTDRSQELPADRLSVHLDPTAPPGDFLGTLAKFLRRAAEREQVKVASVRVNGNGEK